MSGTLTPPDQPRPSDKRTSTYESAPCPHGFRWRFACKTCNPAITPSGRTDEEEVY